MIEAGFRDGGTTGSGRLRSPIEVNRSARGNPKIFAKDMILLQAILSSVRLVSLAAVLAATLALGGCYDIESEVRFNPNASGDAKVRIGFDSEANELFALIRTLAQFSDDPKAAVLSAGVCSQALLIKAPPDVKRHTRIQQYSEDDRLYCKVAMHLPQLDPKLPNPDGYGILTFTRSGPRRWQIELDLDRMPDLTPFLMLAMMSELRKNPSFGDRIRGAEMNEIIAAAKKAYIALTAIAMRGRHVQLTIRAPKIVSSVGAVSDDGRAAVFRFSYTEIAKMMVDPTARAGKRYAVEVEY